MEQPDLSFFVDAAYGVAAALLVMLVLASLLRARRARRALAALEDGHEA